MVSYSFPRPESKKTINWEYNEYVLNCFHTGTGDAAAVTVVVLVTGKLTAGCHFAFSFSMVCIV